MNPLNIEDTIHFNGNVTRSVNKFQSIQGTIFTV